MFWQQLDFLLNGLLCPLAQKIQKVILFFSVHLRSASSEGTQSREMLICDYLKELREQDTFFNSI